MQDAATLLGPDPRRQPVRGVVGLLDCLFRGAEREHGEDGAEDLLAGDPLDRDGTSAAYDFILYDTPPNFGFHTVNALAATNYVLIPLQMSGFAVRGLKEVLRAVNLARSRLNPELQVLGMVPTFVNLRTNFSQQLLSGLADLAGLRIFQTLIPPTVKLQETSLAGVPIVAYAPASKAAAAYRQLAEEVLQVV